MEEKERKWPSVTTTESKILEAKEKLKILSSKIQSKIDYEMLNHLRDEVYATAKSLGFHSEPEVNIGNHVANLHAEISELWEAYRGNKLNEPCDKSEKMMELFGESLTCLEEELADVCIRSLDMSKDLNIDIGRAVRIKNQYNKTRAYRNGGKIA